MNHDGETALPRPIAEPGQVEESFSPTALRRQIAKVSGLVSYYRRRFNRSPIGSARRHLVQRRLQQCLKKLAVLKGRLRNRTKPTVKPWDHSPSPLHADDRAPAAKSAEPLGVPGLGVFQQTAAAHANQETVDQPELVTHISPRAYLRSVGAILWGVFRHPFSTTVVDLSTGDSVHLRE